MEIKLTELTDTISRYQFTIEGGDLTRVDERFSCDRVTCQAELRKEKEIVLLRGSYEVQLRTACDFCLCETALTLKSHFELDLVPVGKQVEPAGDVEVLLDSRDVETYTGEKIELASFFEDQIILDVPVRILCDEACRGICCHCGENLNQEACRCQQDSEYRPFTVLKSLTSSGDSQP